MNILLEQYKILVEFLGKALGPNYEIVLHDLSAGDNTIAAIANGEISGRSHDAPLSSLAMRFLSEQKKEPFNYKVGYRGISRKRTELRSSTFFIKDENDEIIGMLCINFDPSGYVQAANSILANCGLSTLSTDIMSGGTAVQSWEMEETENFMQNMPDVVRCTIEEVSGQSNIPADRLTMEEKIEIVKMLYQGGVFFLKGAVSEVANQLCTSEATIYRYLGKLKK